MIDCGTAGRAGGACQAAAAAAAGSSGRGGGSRVGVLLVVGGTHTWHWPSLLLRM